MANAGYTFLPWLRKGMAAGITRPDGTMTGAPRANVPVTLAIDAAGDVRPVTTALSLLGPGEVGGLDARHVIRRWPPPGAADAAPNDLPMVELSQPDLPWRYTPATEDVRARVRPWLVLVVLTDDEIDALTAGATGRLMSVTVPGSALPRLDQSWAWSHVQVEGFDPATESLENVIHHQPRRVRARLIGPRRLRERTSYTAMLVPAFERGRLAGLGEQVPENLDGLVPSWTPASAQVRLPVYFRWTFHTGEAVDFEVLARRLTARSVGATTGQLDLDVSAPDPALPAAAAQPLPMSGALRSPEAVPGPWDPAERGPFVTALATLLNGPTDALDGSAGEPYVAPPLWGRWHAATARLDPDAGTRWFHELNADPRLRATAGLGAEVVRRNQEALMAAAWDQLEDVIAANAALRQAQLAREAAIKLRDKHLSPLDTEGTVRVASPLHSRFTAAGARTLHGLVETSPIPDGALDGQLRRLTRPAGPLVRRAAKRAGGSTSLVARAGLLARLNEGELRARPLTAPPTGPEFVAKLIPQSIADGGRVPPPEWGPTITHGAPVPLQDEAHADRAETVGRFVKALDDLVDDLTQQATPGPVLTPVDLPAFATTLIDNLDPRQTIPAGLQARMRLADWVSHDGEDPLEPVLAAPEFDLPMYESLLELSDDWLLPGVGTIPPETVTLLVADQRFVEAYLAGLNHEMARELLYREFPTDQRGTYFRQFWDSRAAMSPTGVPTDPEDVRDIAPMHQWRRDRPLGENSGRTPALSEDQVVLLIKGEVLRRHPTAVVYAVKTELNDAGQRTLGTQTRYPIFQARLDPDLTFFGFDLLPSEVRGTTDEGWYFVLAEHPSEPRFGLDVDNGEYAGRPTAWRDLNWAHLAADAESLDSLGYLDLDHALPDSSGIVPSQGEPHLAWHGPDANGSDLAWITLQPPFRVAIHGSDLLPEDPA